MGLNGCLDSFPILADVFLTSDWALLFICARGSLSLSESLGKLTRLDEVSEAALFGDFVGDCADAEFVFSWGAPYACSVRIRV